MSAVSRYHPVWVAAHWLTAILVAVSLFGGITVLRHTPNSDVDKAPMLAAHVIAGFAILLFVVMRLIMRVSSAKPPPADVPSVWLNRLRKTVHVLLYFVIIAMVSTGVGTVLASGALPVIFGGAGSLPADFWAYPPRAGHFFFSRALLVLVTLHFCAAIYHHFVRRDNLLSRMWFGKRRSS